MIPEEPNKAIQPAAEERRRRSRREYVDRLLTEFGVGLDALAESTQKELGEWARQVQLVEDQPSANWRGVVLQLSVAVESQLAAGLGTVQALAFLAQENALGWKVRKLREVSFDTTVEHEIMSRGIKPAFVESELADLMSRLAACRNPKIHGRAYVQSFTEQDANEVRQLAGRILQGVAAALRRSGS